MARFYFLVAICVATLLMVGRGASSLAPPSPSGEASPMVGDGSGASASSFYSSSRPVGSSSSADGADTVLERRGDGHFYANVEINGTPIEMMVDTGASGVALSRDDARRTGIATTIGMSDHVGDGASGAVYGDVVEVERLRFGKVEVDHLEAVVMRGGETSLLGQDVLRQFDRVEIEGDRMILR